MSMNPHSRFEEISDCLKWIWVIEKDLPINFLENLPIEMEKRLSDKNHIRNLTQKEFNKQAIYNGEIR